jgi:hypothetical protein
MNPAPESAIRSPDVFLVRGFTSRIKHKSSDGTFKNRRDVMKDHRIMGGGGTQLNLVETGNLNGRPILFIHGFSRCRLAWSRQLNSELAADYRLLAMDIRGHGLSDKPRGTPNQDCGLMM